MACELIVVVVGCKIEEKRRWEENWSFIIVPLSPFLNSLVHS